MLPYGASLTKSFLTISSVPQLYDPEQVGLHAMQSGSYTKVFHLTLDTPQPPSLPKT